MLALQLALVQDVDVLGGKDEMVSLQVNFCFFVFIGEFFRDVVAVDKLFKHGHKYAQRIE
jgi:hypothetical protein